MTRIPKMSPHDIIEVEWIDSTRMPGGWSSRAEYQQRVTELEGVVHKSAGYLLEATEHSVTVIQSWAVFEPPFGPPTESVTDAINIPMRAIDRITVVSRHAE